jgi:hypothetical protein
MVASMTGEMSARVSCRNTGHLETGGIKHRHLVRVLAGEVLDAQREGPIGILAMHDDDADALLDQFQRAVEEIRRVDGPRPDPLHLFEDAHAVVPGLRPASARRRDDVIGLIW